MKYFITGGTGSFGNAMIENLIRDPGVDEIRVYSRDEVKQEQLVLKYGSKVTCILGDVRDKDALYRAMKGCTHVFCAAAMKQVPACEANVLNALSVNVQGTINTVEVALQHNVSSVVFLSTDKAVEPITVMGMTKSLAEKAVFELYDKYKDHVRTRVNITRYGNVSCSRGSVIPKWIKAIKNNEPIYMTDPEMTRFIMSMEDAIDLVRHAERSEKTRCIFLYRPYAYDLQTLKTALSRLLHKEYDVTVLPCTNRGTEKMHESLVAEAEGWYAYFIDPVLYTCIDTTHKQDMFTSLCSKEVTISAGTLMCILRGDKNVMELINAEV